MVRRLPQQVPQAEPGMCRNARGYVPPRLTHPFPTLWSGCGSPAKALLQTPLGWFSGRSIAAQGQASGRGHSRKLWAAEQAMLPGAKKNNMVQEKWTREGLRLWG